MHKYINTLFVLFVLASQFLVQQATAQGQKTLKETMADLKKSLHPDKAFILPYRDSTDKDLKAFLFAVQETKGVVATQLKMEAQKAIITVDTKSSMANLWNHLPEEVRDRFRVEERTPTGFILSIDYPTNQKSSVATSDPTQTNQKNSYTPAEQEAAKEYTNPDTSTKNKSVWQQQKDYAEKMRQRDHDWATGHQGYTNPDNYDDKASKAKAASILNIK
ncbi:MAG: hypothetical protein ABI688_06595 [Bacteroidota bacterium]